MTIDARREKTLLGSSERVVLGEARSDESVPPAEARSISPDWEQLFAQARLDHEQQLRERDDRIVALEQQLQQERAAHQEAESSLHDLQAQLESARVDAQQRGYAEGQASARSEVRSEWEQTAASWQSSLEELVHQHNAHGAALLDNAGELALAATVKIIGEQVCDAGAIRRALEHLIEECGLKGPLKLLLAPLHYEQLKSAGLPTSLANRSVELFPDSRVTHGGCLLEGTGGMVDGRYDVQLQKLRDIVRGHGAGNA